jgi:hypothetical protein
VIPPDGGDPYDRGTLLGGLLNHGGDEALADLALVDVACLPVDALAKRTGRPVEGAPLLALVEPEPTGVRVTPVDPVLPPAVDGMRGEFDEADRVARERVDALAAALHAVLAPDVATIERRAAAAERAIDADDLALVRDALAKERTPSPLLVHRAAALVRLEAERDPERREVLVAALAETARGRLVTKPPPGARWAQSHGCGTFVEGQPRDTPMPACGMGMVPEVSRRFLTFLAAGG